MIIIINLSLFNQLSAEKVRKNQKILRFSNITFTAGEHWKKNIYI